MPGSGSHSAEHSLQDVAAQEHQDPALAGSEATNVSEQSITANTKRRFLSMYCLLLKGGGSHLKGPWIPCDGRSETPVNVKCRSAEKLSRDKHRACGQDILRLRKGVKVSGG